jgi:diacylglycerol kinase (ATP)
MTTVAVIAHSRKTLGGGLGELREVLARQGVLDPVWYEVPKSRKAPRKVRKALEDGADVILAWGGDGMMQRCADVLRGTGVPLGMLPAGTGNLLATNLGIPIDLEGAVEVALHGDRVPIDTGTMNGETFAVMAGAGFDALMIKDADGALKDRLGRAAYLWTGMKNISAAQVSGKVKVDGDTIFKGRLSCVLVGNVPKVFASIEAFEGSRPDDGLLEVAVVSAGSVLDWTRTVSRVVLDRAEKSPFVETSRGRTIVVKLDRPMVYELDGGERTKAKTLKVKVHPASLVVCVPPRSDVAQRA